MMLPRQHDFTASTGKIRTERTWPLGPHHLEHWRLAYVTEPLAGLNVMIAEGCAGLLVYRRGTRHNKHKVQLLAPRIAL